MRIFVLRMKLSLELKEAFFKFLDKDELYSIYDAAIEYEKKNIPLVIFAGKEYGTGSSRDWAAKGTKLY